MRALLTAVVALLVAAPAAVACGGPLEPTDGGDPASLVAERAFVIHAHGRETIIPTLDLKRDRRTRSALLVPVPATPRVSAAPKGLFSYAGSVTHPRHVESQASPGGPVLTGGGAPDGGVEVVSHEQIGPADVAVLRSGKADAVAQWLSAHGFKLQDAAKPAMRAYTRMKWAFVAIRLTRGGAGTSAPVAISFPSRRIAYPKRFDILAGRKVPMRLYVLSAHRVTAPGLETIYAGRVADLSKRPPSGLRSTFRKAAYLTRLETDGLARAALKRDLVLKRAGSDAPLRKVIYD